MASINILPNEVLLRIFHYYLQIETQVNFLNCVPKVCKKWKKLSKDSSLFETLDGSLSLKSIVYLAKAGALQRTKTLKFGEIEKDISKQYKIIYRNTPRLKHLDLTGVCPNFKEKTKHAVFSELEGLCPDLCELVLSHQDADCKAVIMASIFDHILHVRGANFVKLDFSRVNLPNLQKVFVQIAANCPNLEELLAQKIFVRMYMCVNKISYDFPIYNMQKGCPKLKTLRLGYPIAFVRKSREVMDGFPNLEVFTHPSGDHFNYHASHLGAILWNSPKLKILDLEGCVVTYELLDSLPATDLEQIYLSYTYVAESIVFAKLFRRWSHSLNVIDVSHGKGKHLNEMFKPSHLPNGLPNLEVLELSYTDINQDALEIIILQCPKLRFLNLRCCRSLSRETRSIYRSRSAIEDLLLKFDNKMDCN